MSLLKRLDSLFVKTSLTLCFGLTLFILLAISLAWFFVLSPLSNRTADDMAALISITSKTWASLPAQERIDFEKQVAQRHGLFFSNKKITTQKLKKFYPFVPRLEKALRKYTEQPITIKQGIEKVTCFWFELYHAKEKVNIGFFYDRQGPRPPLAFTGIFIGATLLILFIPFFLVRRITLPIKRLSNAANQFGQGQFSTRIPETGPTELASLAHSFNHMAKKIAQLMENRTILFGGISHDLRTPITRMQVALELLEQDKDKALITSLKNDLKEMESLIKKSLEFVKGLDNHHVTDINLDDIIASIVEDYRKQDLFIHLKSGQCRSCKIDVNAFRRVLTNLIDNAFRYGENSLVTLSYKKQHNSLIIQVLDEGPGIPVEKIEAVFQPFYRIEHSRNKKTGGSGLGLAIVRQLCDAHGWKIELIPRKERGVEAHIIIPTDIT